MNNKDSYFINNSANPNFNQTNKIFYLGSNLNVKDNINNFNGAFSSLIINDINIDLVYDSLQLKNIKYLNTCYDKKCKNNGICIPTQNRLGFRCKCKKSFYGDFCESLKQCYGSGKIKLCLNLTKLLM